MWTLFVVSYVLLSRQGNADEYAALFEKLKTIEVEGISFGGPYVGVGHNATTKAIVEKGRPVIPFLIKRLDKSGVNESIWIVFCLRELKAKEASPAINDLKRQLEAKERFSNIRRDFTLEMQIHFFLKDLKTWD
jgi:hypothetical protein